MIVRFWDSDEEFPATLQLLADKNILDYMHYETLMFALSYLLDRLKSEMDALKIPDDDRKKYVSMLK